MGRHQVRRDVLSQARAGRQSSGHCDRTSLMLEPPPAARKSASRNVYAFGLTSFLNDTASEMAYWVLPAFLASIGAGAAQLGIIEGVAERVASFAKLFSGYLADKVRTEKHTSELQSQSNIVCRLLL